MRIDFPSADPRLADRAYAEQILDRFHWHLSIEKTEEEIRLRGGELLIGTFDDDEELNAFVTGMALALSLLPDDVTDIIDRWAGA